VLRFVDADPKRSRAAEFTGTNAAPINFLLPSYSPTSLPLPSTMGTLPVDGSTVTASASTWTARREFVDWRGVEAAAFRCVLAR
jgi:hypothetical protein